MSFLRLFVSSLVVRSTLTLLGSAGPVSPSLVSISVSSPRGAILRREDVRGRRFSRRRLRLRVRHRRAQHRRRARSVSGAADRVSTMSSPRSTIPRTNSSATAGVSAGTRYPARLRLAIPGHRIAAPRARRRSLRDERFVRRPVRSEPRTNLRARRRRAAARRPTTRGA